VIGLRYKFKRQKDNSMGHKIVEAVIENGQLKYIDKKLPAGRIKVHLIYDAIEESLPTSEVTKIIKESSGIYKDIDAQNESKKLRGEWERNAHN